MIKICVLLTLAIAGVVAQEGPAPGAGPSEATAEPYSYGYQTDSHAASEQRDPQGKVTGFYTINEADGRERRVEYFADESGFHAKVATNEVGTKTSNPADVEVQASEPTPGQYYYQPQQQQYQGQQPQYQPQQPQYQGQQAPPPVRQQVVTQQRFQQPQYVRNQQVQYGQQPQYGYTQGGYGYGSGYGSGAGYRGSYYGTAGYGAQNVGNYNNHLPSQYYRSVQTTQTGTPAAVGGQNVRYVSQPGVTSTGVRAVTYPAGGVAYGQTYGQTYGQSYGQSYGAPAGVPAGVAAPTRTVGPSSQGSSNYLVLQKRAAEEKKDN